MEWIGEVLRHVAATENTSPQLRFEDAEMQCFVSRSIRGGVCWGDCCTWSEVSSEAEARRKSLRLTAPLYCQLTNENSISTVAPRGSADTPTADLAGRAISFSNTALHAALIWSNFWNSVA